MIRTLIHAVALLLLTTGCGGSKVDRQPTPSSQPKAQPPIISKSETPRGELLGVWVFESGEALGQKSPDKSVGAMKLELHPDKATWHFRLSDGWKAFDGTLRYDPKSNPKQIDLSQPNNPDTVALGIYKIEGNKLTISMSAERPKSFEESKPSLAKLVLKRQ